MTTVISWLNAIRDAILLFLEIVPLLQRIADSMETGSSLTGDIAKRESYGRKLNTNKVGNVDSTLDSVEHGFFSADGVQFNAGGTVFDLYSISANTERVYNIPLRLNEQCLVKFISGTGEDNQVQFVAVTSDIIIGTELVTPSNPEFGFSYTAISGRDVISITIHNPTSTMCQFSASVKFQMTQNPAADDTTLTKQYTWFRSHDSFDLYGPVHVFRNRIALWTQFQGYKASSLNFIDPAAQLADGVAITTYIYFPIEPDYTYTSDLARLTVRFDFFEINPPFGKDMFDQLTFVFRPSTSNDTDNRISVESENDYMSVPSWNIRYDQVDEGNGLEGMFTLRFTGYEGTGYALGGFDVSVWKMSGSPSVVETSRLKIYCKIPDA